MTGIPRPNGAPDGPDFWVLSDIILKFDGDTSEGGKNFQEVVDEIYPDLNVNEETIGYMATQRAMRGLGIQTMQQARAARDQIAILAALWMEGFTVGVAAHDRLREIDNE